MIDIHLSQGSTSINILMFLSIFPPMSSLKMLVSCSSSKLVSRKHLLKLNSHLWCLIKRGMFPPSFFQLDTRNSLKYFQWDSLGGCWLVVGCLFGVIDACFWSARRGSFAKFRNCPTLIRVCSFQQKKKKWVFGCLNGFALGKIYLKRLPGGPIILKN